MQFSIFYFADDAEADGDRYRLLLEGARFADDNGFTAVWTPERHFHRFGGLFPNPSVTAAAVAAVTTRIGVRAGSVVAPLHHPLRVAEEWAVVDNISGGRAGISLASGWQRRDFVLRPEAYDDRRQSTIDMIDTVRRLWRGEPYIDDRAGFGEYRVFPRPVQPDLPMWLTSGGSTETIEAAGKAGVGVLTHLLSHSIDQLADKVVRYREAYAASGAPGRGHVTLMVHAYLDEDLDAAERRVREPLRRYLASSLDLTLNSAAAAGSAPTVSEARIRLVVDQAYDRYLHHDGLFGSVATAAATVARIRAADVDEIACLIDFGVPADDVLRGLERLADLRVACDSGGSP